MEDSTGFMPSYLTALVVVAVTLYVIYIYRHFTLLRRYGLPGPTPWPLVGNMPEQMSQGLDVMDLKWRTKYGKTFGYYSGHQPFVFVSDPEDIKTVMVKDFPHFIDRMNPEGAPKLLRDTLFNMRGRRWKQTRNILTPAFSAARLKQFVPILNKNATTLVTNMSKHVGEDVEIRKFFKHFTMDAIASTAFGIDVDSQNQPDDPFVANVEPILKPSLRNKIVFMLSQAFPTIGNALAAIGLSRFPKESMDFYERTGQMLIEDRKKNKKEQVDFIQMLLEGRLDSNKAELIHNGVDLKSQANQPTNKSSVEKLTDDEINAQAFLFFIAGFETTASLLRYASYVLALHPEIDEKLIQEIQEKIGDDTPSYNQIASLSYMDMFVDEVLRMYPPVTRLNREAADDIRLGDKTIPKGTAVVIPVWYIQHHEDYYPEPETFKPERFSPENKASHKKDGLTYLPFGEGPRHCIGMRLALVEAKIALVYVLRKVRFSKCEQTQVPLQLTHFGLLRPKQEVYVHMSER